MIRKMGHCEDELLVILTVKDSFGISSNVRRCNYSIHDGPTLFIDHVLVC